MLARLGFVLWWTGLVVGVPLFAFGLYLVLFEPDMGTFDMRLLLLLPGIAAVLIGRALRYILAGV